MRKSQMRYLSLFSGVEAAHLAWAPLGWECAAVAEIEPAACAVLAHRLGATRPRYLPDSEDYQPARYARIAFGERLPNLGDVSQVTLDDIAALGRIDVVIGGSPCQDLSVAGRRAGLAGARSSLFHEQVRIFDAARHLCGARWLVWENVPGAFSTNGGRDFAVVVGALAGLKLDVPEEGWGNEGVAAGPRGLVEWSVLDAQWFGVAQRRRRVFAVLDTGNWADRPPVLLEPDRLRGDSPPHREARKDVAPAISARPTGGGGLGTDFDLDGGLVQHAVDVAPCLRAGGNATGGDRPYGTDADTAGSLVAYVPEIARCVATSQDYETTTMVAHAIQAGALRTNPNSGPDGVGVQEGVAYTLEARAEVQAVCVTSDVAHTLKAEGADASEDGTGRVTPIVSIAVALRGREGGAAAELGDDCGFTLRASEGGGDKPYVMAPIAFNARQDPDAWIERCGPLDTDGCSQAVAFSCKDFGADAGEISPTLRAMQHGTSHANAGGQVAVAFQTAGGNVSVGDISGTLRCNADRATGSAPMAQQGMAVRRLTPRECERLQGMPDDWTLVPFGGKPMSDGPRYRMIGNSFAVPVIRWIGEQIAHVQAINSREAAYA